MNQKTPPSAGEVYVFYVPALKKYGAYQIVSVDLSSKSICYAARGQLAARAEAAFQGALSV